MNKMQTIEVTSLKGARVIGVGTFKSHFGVRAVIVEVSDKRILKISPKIAREICKALGYTLTNADKTME